MLYQRMESEFDLYSLVLDRGSLGPSTVTLMALVYVATWGGVVDTVMVMLKLFPGKREASVKSVKTKNPYPRGEAYISPRIPISQSQLEDRFITDHHPVSGGTRRDESILRQTHRLRSTDRVTGESRSK